MNTGTNPQSLGVENGKQQLPVRLLPSVIGHILSYNVESVMDLATFRLVCRDAGSLMQAALVKSTKERRLIRVPQHKKNLFRGELLELTDRIIATKLAAASVKELYEAFWNRHQSGQTCVEGVAIVDNAIPVELLRRLDGQIDTLALDQAGADMSGSVYHNRYAQVRQVVHPSLYPFIEGVSSLCKPLEDAPQPTVPTRELYDREIFNRYWRDCCRELNFWNRIDGDRSCKHLWLPTYFDISPDGSCTIEDYINNVLPRNKYEDTLYASLARLFEAALPYMESVYSYALAIKPVLQRAGIYGGYRELDSSSGHLCQEFSSLRGQKLQVITKIIDYELLPGQSHEGHWHVEGTSQEDILLTCVYTLSRDEALSGGSLQFKRAFSYSESKQLETDVYWSDKRWELLEQVVRPGYLPLGTVETHMGRLVVFPNSHVHKVAEMVNCCSSSSPAKRRIVVFNVVNPMRRVISTREVAPQQAEVGGPMSRKEALEHREAMSDERRNMVLDWGAEEVLQPVGED